MLVGWSRKNLGYIEHLLQGPFKDSCLRAKSSSLEVEQMPKFHPCAVQRTVVSGSCKDLRDPGWSVLRLTVICNMKSNSSLL